MNGDCQGQFLRGCSGVAAPALYDWTMAWMPLGTFLKSTNR